MYSTVEENKKIIEHQSQFVWKKFAIKIIIIVHLTRTQQNMS